MVLNYRPKFLKCRKPTRNYQIFHKNVFFENFQKLIPKYLGIGTKGSNIVKIFNKLQLEVLWFIKLEKLGMEGS
jgi:hypothetical protein